MDDGTHHLVRYAKSHALSLEQLQNAHGHALEVGQCLVRGGQRDQLGHILLEKAHHIQLRQTVESGVDRLGGAVTVALSLRLAQRALRLADDEHFKMHAHLQKQLFLAFIKLIEGGL